MPKISVIIPAYNAELTIRETIESVQKQTLSDWELIVVNDGSSDRTLEVVKSINDERLKIFDYQQAGVSIARNRGMSQATGEYIAFLDADDLWTVDKLELQLEALRKNPEAGVAYSWTSLIDEQGKLLYPGNRIFYEGDVYGELLLTNFLISASNPLISKQAIASIDGFDSNIRLGEDWEFYLRLAAKWQFIVVPRFQLFYRQYSNSTSYSKVEEMNNMGIIMLETAFAIAPPKFKNLRNKSLSLFHIYCAEKSLKYINQGNYIHQAGEYIWEAIVLHPPILVGKDTLRLTMKYLLKRFLPTNISDALLQFIKVIKNNSSRPQKITN
jgi:glycosyltransferase involved in cell wall biosynthesis